MVSDFIALMSGCVGIFFITDPRAFGIAVIAGVCLAALCWYLCTVYTRLWNKRYTVTMLHHIFCGTASLLTLVFVVLFASLNYTEQAALKFITSWQNELTQNEAWAGSMYSEAYEKIRQLGTEDLSRYPPPELGGSTIPLTHAESNDAIATLYADGAYSNFQNSHTFLSKISGIGDELPKQAIVEDLKGWSFSKGSYPVSRAIAIAANQVEAGLVPQLSGLASRTRWTLIFLFSGIQAFAFGSIGWSAYRDIKVRM